jgi:hypothetical protein
MQEKKQKRSIGQCKCCRLHFFDDCGNEELCEHCSLFISDYTKQVRKEVCELIWGGFIALNNINGNYEYKKFEGDFRKFLDHIQGVEDGTINNEK